MHEERDEFHLKLHESVWLEPGLRLSFKRKDGVCLIETTDECLADVTVDGRTVVNSLMYSPGQDLKINGSKYLLVPKETRLRPHKFIHRSEIVKNNPSIYFILSGLILFLGLSLLDHVKIHSKRIYSERTVIDKNIDNYLRGEITNLDRALKEFGNDKAFLIRKIEVLSHMARANPELARLAFVKIQNKTKIQEVRNLTRSIISRL